MKKISLILVFTVATTFIFGQGIINNGAVINITSGTYVTVDNGGGYFNGTSGQIQLDGTLQIEGNFENNSISVADNVFINTDGVGTVLFTGTADQHILNTTANAFIDFENLTVNKTSGTVFVDAGSAVTVNGDLTVTAGTFRLASPADGESPSGSLITKGNVTGTGNLYVDRHFETFARWQYISVPVDNATDDMFDNTNLANNFNPNLYTYDETYDAIDPPNTNYSNWSDPAYELYNAWTQTAVNGSAVALTPGTGYITYNEIELDVSFGGSPSNLNNAVSYSPSISYNFNDGNGGYYDGWNIIGNPYPCAIDFTTLTLNNINNVLYMWDGDKGNYKYFDNGGTTYDDGSNIVNGATQYIPAMQSFAVKAVSVLSPSVTINNTDRTHNTQSMWKSAKDAPNYGQTQFVKLRTEEGNFYDETVVRFFDAAQENFDNEYDAYKMFPNQPPVMIYSLLINPEIPVAINSLPLSSLNTSIPLGFISDRSGTYTITAEDVVFDAGTDVKLIDTYENTETLLNNGTSYTFTTEGGEVRDRFYLFTAASGSDVDENKPDEFFEYSSDIWSSSNKVYITIKSNEMINAQVQIYDVLGRTVIDKNINGAYNIINVPGASGTYFVKLRTNDGKVTTDKVFIQK